MLRNKKIEIKQMIEIIDDYYLNICKKNLGKMTYTSIAKYMSKKYNMTIREYDIRRCEDVVNHIKELKEISKSLEYSNFVVYNTLDVEAFINKNNSLQSLKKALVELDQYYAHVCESAALIFEKSEILENKNKTLINSLSDLCNEKEHLIQALREEHIKNREMNIILKKVKNILITNVYPEIANVLLRENGLLKDGEEIISSEGKAAIMSDTDSINKVITKAETLYSNNTVIQGLFNKL